MITSLIVGEITLLLDVTDQGPGLTCSWLVHNAGCKMLPAQCRSGVSAKGNGLASQLAFAPAGILAAGNETSNQHNKARLLVHISLDSRVVSSLGVAGRVPSTCSSPSTARSFPPWADI